MTVGEIFIGQANQGLALTHSERSVRIQNGGLKLCGCTMSHEATVYCEL